MSRSRGGSKRKKQTGKKKQLDPVKFWGDPEKLPQPEGFETSTPDPVAVVNSLGQPPLPGHGAASPHYFKLVYARATQLAGALAMAGEIDELVLPEPDEPEPEPEEAPAEPGNELEDEPLAEVGSDEEPNELPSTEAADSEDE